MQALALGTHSTYPFIIVERGDDLEFYYKTLKLPVPLGRFHYQLYKIVLAQSGEPTQVDCFWIKECVIGIQLEIRRKRLRTWLFEIMLIGPASFDQCEARLGDAILQKKDSIITISIPNSWVQPMNFDLQDDFQRNLLGQLFDLIDSQEMKKCRAAWSV